MDFRPQRATVLGKLTTQQRSSAPVTAAERVTFVIMSAQLTEHEASLLSAGITLDNHLYPSFTIGKQELLDADKTAALVID